jgi:diaminohydroxyphosphoribosylaminopyrimidine deaminase/5-amino-6-(5-phosphoribosylamino)uracil reductase
MFSYDDVRWMRRALRLAARGWGRVQPNPMVGAVLVRDGVGVGEGWHGAWGGPHAEIVALRAAGEQARGATLHVTLEPCAHHGKTPPCTDAILAAGVARVVIAGPDPNPEATGGMEVLRAAGVAVESGLLAGRARRLNAAFYHIHENGRPWLALKLAVSVDGRIAARPGERTPLTSAGAAAWVQRLRAGFDAIMVGGRTAAVDDPLLTVRGPLLPRVPPVRVVVGSASSLRPESALVRTSDRAPVWLVTPEREPALAAGLQAGSVRVLRVPAAGLGSSPQDAVSALWREGIRSILCEGGGRLAGSLLAAGLVRRIYLLTTPRALGEEGVPAFPAGLAGTWAVAEARRVGRDALLVLEPMDLQE